MKRHLVIGGVHFLLAILVTLMVLLAADVTGWQGPRGLAIGGAAFLVAFMTRGMGEAVYRRWFG